MRNFRQRNTKRQEDEQGPAVVPFRLKQKNGNKSEEPQQSSSEKRLPSLSALKPKRSLQNESPSPYKKVKRGEQLGLADLVESLVNDHEANDELVEARALSSGKLHKVESVERWNRFCYKVKLDSSDNPVILVNHRFAKLAPGQMVELLSPFLQLQEIDAYTNWRVVRSRVTSHDDY